MKLQGTWQVLPDSKLPQNQMQTDVGMATILLCLNIVLYFPLNFQVLPA